MVNSLTSIQQQLVRQVQRNCDISDASHAGDYTLCIYLLKMREYYRWLHTLDYADELDSGKMSHWLKQRENLWEQLIDEPFQAIQLKQQCYEIFDTDKINDAIQSQKLFYHAGIGQKVASHFFIAELLDSYIDPSFNTKITITGNEFARDLTAPPAISNQHEIIIRQGSLKRLCWERYQEWQWNQYDNTMGTALAYYPFDESISQALQLMVEVEQHTLIQHELGEMNITHTLGPDWPAMMLKIMGTKAELQARSVRDNLADCLRTLPFLIEQNNAASLHFYFANMTYMRKTLFPASIQAYQQWVATGALEPLSKTVHQAIPHWEDAIQSLLILDKKSAKNMTQEMTDLIEQAVY